MDVTEDDVVLLRHRPMRVLREWYRHGMRGALLLPLPSADSPGTGDSRWTPLVALRPACQHLDAHATWGVAYCAARPGPNSGFCVAHRLDYGGA